jgi:hypothetical protein
MDIRPTGNLDPLSRLGVNGTKKPAPPPAADNADFSDTAAIQEALAALPESRPEVVEQGKGLVAQATYPPPETIKRISNLLAVKFEEQTA